MASLKVELFAFKAGVSNNEAKRRLGLKHAIKKHVRVATEKAAGGKRAAKIATKKKGK